MALEELYVSTKDPLCAVGVKVITSSIRTVMELQPDKKSGTGRCRASSSYCCSCLRIVVVIVLLLLIVVAFAFVTVALVVFAAAHHTL